MPTEAEAALGPDAARELQRLVDEQRPRIGIAEHVTADGLVEAWQWLVEEVEEGYDDISEEYANDLSTRAILDDLVAVAPQALAEAITAWADPLDRRFLAATTEAAEPLLGASDPASPDAASRWYRRIPRKLVGDLADDLRADGLA